MREADLQENILEYVRYVPTVLAFHARPARMKGADGQDRWVTAMSGDKGFPDLVLAGPRGVLYRELKTARGRTTEGQDFWLEVLLASGQDATIWRPADWPERVMREIGEIR